MQASAHPMGCGASLALALCMPLSYVALVQLFDRDGIDRNHTVSIKRRFTGAFLNNIISVGCTWMILKQGSSTPLRDMGLHVDKLLNAIFFPCILMFTLYFGQFVMMFYDRTLGNCFDLKSWLRSFRSATWLRDIVLGPVTEEIAFRCCSVVLMSQCASSLATVFLSPVPFALSHFHHVFDDQRRGFTPQQAFLKRTFQFAYTYIFGVFASYLLLSTRHALVPIVAHSICNSLGLPLLHEIGFYPKLSQRATLWISYIAGFAPPTTALAVVPEPRPLNLDGCTHFLYLASIDRFTHMSPDFWRQIGCFGGVLSNGPRVHVPR
ncbi:unnamed protein product [Caenorhabditis auriculariae]|uniref:CAAX prenyl protease 2 n=1 Tax=Caenorhabditis auriculariae TaxID=2777116 RepID=A0A8S1HM11_9PELO|nr:unnamed protein product [Caenorhabditis auriculariae]